MSDLKQLTVYLSPELHDELAAEARDMGQSGVSARIRHLLEQRSRSMKQGNSASTISARRLTGS